MTTLTVVNSLPIATSVTGASQLIINQTSANNTLSRISVTNFLADFIPEGALVSNPTGTLAVGLDISTLFTISSVGSDGLGTFSLANLSAGQLLGNATSVAGAVGGAGLSSYFDSNFGSIEGEILYRGASSWLALAPGTAGDVLVTDGEAGPPFWGAMEVLGLEVVKGTTTQTSIGTIILEGAATISGGGSNTSTWSVGGATGSLIVADSAGHTETAVTEIVFTSGATVSSGTGTANVSVAGGPGGSGVVLDQGTLSITAGTIVVGSGITLSGAGSTGTLVASGGGGGITYTRPHASAFSAFGSQTTVTVAEPSFAGSPLTLLLVDTSGAGNPNLCGIKNGTLNNTEFLLTAYFQPIQGYVGVTGNGLCQVGIGLENAAGQLFTIANTSNGPFRLDYWYSPTSFDNNYTEFYATGGFGPFWRIYFNAAGAYGSNPIAVLNSYDGASWSLAVTYNGVGPWTGILNPTTAFFYLCAAGQNQPLASSLYHWDVQTGTGGSLNPLSPCNPL